MRSAAPIGRLALVAAVAVGTVASGAAQAPTGRTAWAGMLDEHPAIAYQSRPPDDRVARLNRTLSYGSRTLAHDARRGYLPAVLEALGLSPESQLLIFSKSGLQRDHTGPETPRALYFDDAVTVGYVAGAPTLELAAHDPQQGVMFYTLAQAPTGRPTFVRQTGCLTCHVSAATLDVPGLIARSHHVARDGELIGRLGLDVVDHRTPHTARWGGWFVTAQGAPPPYQPLGHRGNLATELLPSGATIVSDEVAVAWKAHAARTDQYPSAQSDIAGLLVFDHQVRATNLITRLQWESRVAAHSGRAVPQDTTVRRLAVELADYLLFADEAPMAVPVVPHPAFAAQRLARVPHDRRGRSLGALDLSTRLATYPCSPLVYSEAFDALRADVRQLVYARMKAVLDGQVSRTRFPTLTAADRRAVREILAETKADWR